MGEHGCVKLVVAMYLLLCSQRWAGWCLRSLSVTGRARENVTRFLCHFLVGSSLPPPVFSSLVVFFFSFLMEKDNLQVYPTLSLFERLY